MTGNLAKRHLGRNVAWTAINHFFVEGGMTLSDPGTVLPLFVKELTGSNILAGLLPSLRFFGWLLPQFFVAGLLERLAAMLPAIRLLELVRAGSYLGMGLLVLILGGTHPHLVVGIFFVLFSLTRIMAGSSAVARAELVARIVPSEERAHVVSLRTFAGGVAGFIAGFIVSGILGKGDIAFPSNYGLLIGLSGACFGVAIVALTPIREPRIVPQLRRLGFISQIARASMFLREDRRFMLYVLVRALSAGVALATPFYMIYARDVLGAPASMAGVYLSVRTLSRVLSNLVWGKLCRRRGNAWVFQTAQLLNVLAPSLVLLISVLALITPLRLAVLPWGKLAFGLVFLVQGIAASAMGIGRVVYLYEIAPPASRPSYYGLSNTLIGPLYFLPVLGGALVDLWGFVPIFGIAMGFGLLAYALVLRLER